MNRFDAEEEGRVEKRVVVTGLGLVTPVGIGVAETWSALCAGRSGVGPITRFDASAYKTQIAAEVKGFKAEDFLPKKQAKRTERFIAYAVAAARMAIEDSGLKIDSGNEDRVGVLTGCGLGGLDILESTCRIIDHIRLKDHFDIILIDLKLIALTVVV